MKRIGYLKDINMVKSLPTEVKNIIKGILKTLDNEYGSDRHLDNDDGGYVLIIENTEDFKSIKDELYVNLEEDAIPEFVDIIRCKNERIYTNSLILCNNDFGISIIMLLSMTPENLKSYIIEY